MRVVRSSLSDATNIIAEQGCLVIEALPRSGLTTYLSQLRDELRPLYRDSCLYVNCGLPGFHLQQALAEGLGLDQEGTYSSFLACMRQSPRLLLIDRLDLAPAQQAGEFYAVVDRFREARIFDSRLAGSALAVGTCGDSQGRADIKLGYFTAEETAAYLATAPQDELCQAMQRWSQGSPGVVSELSRYLGEASGDSGGEGLLYQAVARAARGGRLSAMASADLSLPELACRGLAVPVGSGALRPLPAYTMVKDLMAEREEHLLVRRRSCEIRFRGRLLPLFPREARIFCLLAERPGQVFSSSQIYSHVNGESCGSPSEETSVKVQLSRLRRKLPPGTEWIITRRNFGYCLNRDAPVRVVD